MSDATNKMPLAAAESLAQALLAELVPACERIAVAGSIRRRRPTVGDIELCAIPKVDEVGHDLLGDALERRPLDAVLERLIALGALKPIKGFRPDADWKYARFEFEAAAVAALKDLGRDLHAAHRPIFHGGGFNLDLFLCDFLTWGCIFTIRTGPAEFSKRLVTDRQHGGLCPSYIRFKDGRLWHRDGTLYGTLEEENIFSTLGLPFIKPEDRQ